MSTFILFAIFPSFVFIWDFLIDILYKIRVDKVDQAFDSIIKDMEEDMQKDSDEYVSVAVVEDQAYWVTDNTFYVAEIIDGEIDKTTSRPVNAFEMSNTDVRKMLFILDNLVEG